MKIHFICNLKLFFWLLPVLAITLQSNTLLAAPCSRCNAESITTIRVERDQSEDTKKTTEILYCSNCNRKPWIESPLSNWGRMAKALDNIGPKTRTVGGTAIGVATGFMAGGLPGAAAGGAAGAALGYRGEGIFTKPRKSTPYVSQANLEDAFKACDTSKIDSSYISDGQLNQYYPALVEAALHGKYGRTDQQVETAHTDTAHSLCFCFIQKKLSKAKHDETLKYFHDKWTDSRAKINFPEDEAALQHSDNLMAIINSNKGIITLDDFEKLIRTMALEETLIIDITGEIQMAIVYANEEEHPFHCYIPRLSTHTIRTANVSGLTSAVKAVTAQMQTTALQIVWPEHRPQDEESKPASEPKSDGPANRTRSKTAAEAEKDKTS